MHIPLAKTLISFFSSIKELVGRKVYLFILTNIILGFLEGIGLALIIPLFFVFQNNESANSSEWLSIVKKIFNFINIEYSNEKFLLLVIIIFLLSRCFALISYKIDAFLFAKGQTEIYRKILKGLERMNFVYFNRFNAGHFNNLLQVESARAIAAIQYYTKAINNLTLTIVLFLIALNNNFLFSVSIVAFAGIVIFMFSKITSETKKISYQLSLDSSQFQTVSMEFLNNFKYLTSTNSFGTFMPYLHKWSEKVTLSKYRMKFLSDRLGVFTMMVMFPGLAGIIYLFIKVLNYPIEGVLVSLIVCQRALSKALSFQSSWQIFNNVFGSYKYFSKSIAEVNQNHERNTGKVIDAKAISIKFSKIEFAYNPDFKIEIDELDIPENSIISLVGSSGSGKTTVLDLISGVYPPSSGAIFVNGLNYEEINLREYRNHIGLVNQENSLFNDTVFDNVSCWAEKNEANLEKVRQSCKLANIHDFIDSLEKKYETEIGDKGLKISGGQRQRLALARELYKNPKLLLLDEATSALDSESEQKIKETIEGLRGKMTIVIVAHRLSTVRNSDKIVVLEKGKIIQVGKFEELINNSNSRFKELVNSQLIKE